MGYDIATNKTKSSTKKVLLLIGLLAQSVERWSNKPTVMSSNLIESTTFSHTKHTHTKQQQLQKKVSWSNGRTSP